MNSDTQHDPGYERRKAEFKREYIKKKRRKRLIHNSIVIAIRVLFVLIVLIIGFKVVDRIFLTLSKTTKSQEVNKAVATAVTATKVPQTPQATPSGSELELLTIINKEHPMEKDYVPELVECYHTIYVDKRVSEDLVSMINQAKEEGYALFTASAYRSEERQTVLYEAKADGDAPYESEHESGLAVDVSSDEYIETDQGFAETKEYAWLKAHCAEYGFIIRYPKGKEEVTGHEFEPYHLRYVGKEAAKEMNEQNLVLEEYK